MMEFIFCLILFLLFFPFTFYPISLIVLDKICVRVNKGPIKEIVKVDFFIIAHNEEDVIGAKIKNLLSLNTVGLDIKWHFILDGCTDKTKKILLESIPNYINFMIHDYERVGKTKAQNLTVPHASSKNLIFTDANSMLDENALIELIKVAQNPQAGYVSANLCWVSSGSDFASSENKYWNFDKLLRSIESKFASTVGGNGALYFINSDYYHDLPDLLSHDGFMPAEVVTKGGKCYFANKSLVFEKQNISIIDEFKRRIRMNRGMPFKYFYTSKKFNFIKYPFFSYFYIGHKFLKYFMWLYLPILYLLTIYLFYSGFFYKCIFWGLNLSLFFAVLSLMFSKIPFIGFFLSFHLAWLAQLVAVIKTITLKNSSIWNKSSAR